jgi:hypothetical protein
MTGLATGLLSEKQTQQSAGISMPFVAHSECERNQTVVMSRQGNCRHEVEWISRRGSQRVLMWRDGDLVEKPELQPGMEMSPPSCQ